MKTLTPAAFLIFLAIAPLAAAPPVPGTDLNGYGSQIVWPENPNFNTYADRLESMGVRWARFDLCWWSITEVTAKNYNFNPPSPNHPGGTWNTDGAIQALVARGIEPFVILSYGHPAYDSGQGPSTANGRLGYADYCAAAATRYKDQIDYWEIWNEPNLDQFWGTTPSAVNYTELVKAAAPRIRAADPTAVIIGGVTSGIDQTYLQTCIDNGLLDAVDAITIHPYRIDRPETINAEVTSVRSRIAAATTKTIPVWTGEWGYNTCWNVDVPNQPSVPLTDKAQAKMLSRMMVNNLAQDVNLSFWFSVHAFTEACGSIDPSDSEWGLVDWSLNPRPSFYAMRTVNERLGAPIRRVSDPFAIALSPTINRQRIEVFQKGAANSRVYTVAVWLARWPVSDSFTGTTTQVGFTLPAATTMSAWDGLTGAAVSISPVIAGSRTNLNNFSAKDYPIFIDITLPEPTPTPTASPTPSPSATPSPSPTLSPTPTASPTPTPEPSPSPSPSPAPTPMAPGTSMTLF